MSRSGEPVQLLTPDGVRVEHPDYDVDLPDDALRGLYRDLVIVRRLDTEATALQRQGQLGLWASLLGQEAAQVGSGRALQPQDFAFPTYREHGVAWCRGVDPLSVLGLFRGATLGGWDPYAHRFHLYTIVVGSQTLHATGYALGVQMDGAQGDAASDAAAEAVIAFMGDGATSEGDVGEAFVWAGVFQAPVVFFCQNNHWAISEPVERQARVPLYRRAEGFGFPGVQVDGNDVLASYAVTKAALDAARTGQGPTLIEAVTYRMGAHTTADDPTRYRLSAEVEAWRVKDPLARMRTYLLDAGFADPPWLGEVDAEADALAATVRAGCLGLPDPDPGSMFDHVYAEEHPALARQRAEHLAVLQAGSEGC